MNPLLVTYPARSTAEMTTVVAVTPSQAGLLFAVERTPCHPRSPRWPDQPADRCTLALDEARVPIECGEGFLAAGVLGLSTDVQGGVGLSEDAVPCVVHRAPVTVEMAVGDKVSLHVDERYREAVSCSHSRCHLVSLALNAALADAWRKQAPAQDSLGNADFDKLAIVSSRIDERGSLDVYRIGKHVRKSGFDVQALDDPQTLAASVARLAKGWLQSSPEILVSPGECALRERRTWSCRLPAGTAEFPCGGTHPSRMEPDDGLSVAIAWEPQERHLAMRAEGGLFHV